MAFGDLRNLMLCTWCSSVVCSPCMFPCMLPPGAGELTLLTSRISWLLSCPTTLPSSWMWCLQDHSTENSQTWCCVTGTQVPNLGVLTYHVVLISNTLAKHNGVYSPSSIFCLWVCLLTCGRPQVLLKSGKENNVKDCAREGSRASSHTGSYNVKPWTDRHWAMELGGIPWFSACASLTDRVPTNMILLKKTKTNKQKQANKQTNSLHENSAEF